MKDNIITWVIAFSLLAVIIAYKFGMIELNTFPVGALAGLAIYHIEKEISKRW